MSEIIITKTIFQELNHSKRTILSQETNTYEINKLYGNSKKADAIFSAIAPYQIWNDTDSETSAYNLKKVNSISIDYSTISYDDTYYPSDNKIDRDGYSIFNTHIDTVIMLECYTYDNKIIRLDFKGHTDASGGGYFTHFNYDIKSWNHYPWDKEIKTKQLIEQIKNEEDHIIELSASPLYKNPVNEFTEESGLQPQGDFAYMVEFFSFDLIDSNNDEYQGCFSKCDYNGKYIRDAMKLINDIETRAKELEEKYSDKGVKVTINDFNEGCQYGMAVYVWIPYQ